LKNALKVLTAATLSVSLFAFSSTKELAPPVAKPARASKNVNAVWMASVYNLDFPKENATAKEQQADFKYKLNLLKSIGINAVIVQVRPTADALYPSKINPWSKVLTGTQGKDPGYDPLKFMIEAARENGMAFHAWLNPYRITTTGTDLSALSENHPARLHPEWVIYHNGAMYYNPELEAVKTHIIETVLEIVNNYDVDAIHFDDYFYPSGYPLPKGESKDGETGNFRRNQINETIRRVSEAIKAASPNALFGISPAGIWKNKSSDRTGSATSGGEAYYNVFSDARAWIKNEWIDYITPQIYWEINFEAADYETLVKWWSNEVKGTNVTLYVGQGAYRDSVAAQLEAQLAINRNYPEVMGSFYYGCENLLNNKKGSAEAIMAFSQK
jgi:uncharacterized lipoprotein YddW (UPF0748 family)